MHIKSIHKNVFLAGNNQINNYLLSSNGREENNS